MRKSVRGGTRRDELRDNCGTGTAVRYVFLNHDESRRLLHIFDEMVRKVDYRHLAEHPNARAVRATSV